MDSFSPSELRTLRSLNTPFKIQKFLNTIPYHIANTAWSPRQVLRQRTAHCLEGAIFAAAALRVNGYPPLVLDLEAINDTDHVITPFRENGAWGAIASSNYPGCRYRQPIHRTLRELALSYFHDYFNDRREHTLRKFSQPVDLRKFDHLDWMTTEGDVWFIAEHLCDIPHTRLMDRKLERSLKRVDERSYLAGTYGRLKKKK
jgi:hypothetical protein